MESGYLPVAHAAALPHLRISGLERPTMLLVRCAGGLGEGRTVDGVEFSSLRAVIFLLSPEEEPGQHLRLLGHLATHIDDAGFLADWLAARGEEELRATFLREERSLTLRVGVDEGTEEWIGQPLRVVQLPPDTLVALIRRGRHGIVPNGSTVLDAGDHMTLIGTPEGIRTAVQRHRVGSASST